MKTSDFNYQLSPELIAQTPLKQRDQSRLMVLHRDGNSIEHRKFHDILDYLERGDLMVFNNSRVIPARIIGQKQNDQTRTEILLLRRLENNVWEALVKPARKLTVGVQIRIADVYESSGAGIDANIISQQEGSIRTIRFSDDSLLEKYGRTPLPPYIHTPLENPERYQTIYAEEKGSVAAPTAGLHFTSRLFEDLHENGIQTTFVTLHIGLDTFQPVRVDNPARHPIHKEYGLLNAAAARMINRTKELGKKIVAVGTSTVRLVEAAAQSGKTQPFAGWVDLFILPGYQFRVTDAMVTNLHLPKSTLLMLVSAFAGRDFILQAYEQAKSQNYRFYSFGDAMLIL